MAAGRLFGACVVGAGNWTGVVTTFTAPQINNDNPIANATMNSTDGRRGS